MATIIELLVFAALAIMLIIVCRKAKRLQRSVITYRGENYTLDKMLEQVQFKIKSYEIELKKQKEQIAEKDAEIEKLNTMLSEPQFTHLDAEVHGNIIYLVCWNRYTEKKFIHTFGLVTDERLRKELLTKIRKLIKYEYYKTADVQS